MPPFLLPAFVDLPLVVKCLWKGECVTAVIYYLTNGKELDTLVAGI
jgi:hypothetical protein